MPSFRIVAAVAVFALFSCSAHGIEVGSRHALCVSADAGVTTVPRPTAAWELITPFAVASVDHCSPSATSPVPAVVVTDSRAPGTVYLSTFYAGIWKSTDSGDHWFKIDTGTNSADIDNGYAYSLVLDWQDANVMYTSSGYVQGGLMKSTDGGVNWQQLFTLDQFRTLDEMGRPFTYGVAMDPSDHLHLLVSTFERWSGYSAGENGTAGLYETLDGGSSWHTIAPASPNIGDEGTYIGFIDSTTWLLGSQYDGFWQTTDSGGHWRRPFVNNGYGTDASISQLGSQLYRSDNGALYLTSDGGIHRSTDCGLTWLEYHFPSDGNFDQYVGIVGDGQYIYAAPMVEYAPSSLANGLTTFRIATESDGTDWSEYSTQTFVSGPSSMAVDRATHVIYSSNQCAGLWRLRTQ